MELNKKDFTEKDYLKILKNINNKTIFFNEVNKKKNFTLWRHDIDFSPHRALALAKIEKKNNIKSTYFIQLSSFYYNIFESSIIKIFFKILSLGHQIGLHFSPTQYKISTKKNLEKHLNFEKKILEHLLKTKIKVFSFHDPTKKILKKYNEFKYANMINTYASYFRDNVQYCSDSNGYWRFYDIRDFLNKKHKRVQVLTHPGWWQKKHMIPLNRVKRCINGRAKKNFKFYSGAIKKSRRKNV